MNVNTLVLMVLGISAAGKSTRIYYMIRYLMSLGYVPEPQYWREKQIGYFFKEINTVFIGKEYMKKDSNLLRWQGLDSVTGAFEGSADISVFMQELASRHNLVMEGAGITDSNRFRPLQFSICGFKRIMMFYFIYGGDEKAKAHYKQRCLDRTGKEPTKDSMWVKDASFFRGSQTSREEQQALESQGKAEVSVQVLNPEEPVDALGVQFFEKVDAQHVEAFKTYCKTDDYLQKNKYVNWHVPEDKGVKLF